MLGRLFDLVDDLPDPTLPADRPRLTAEAYRLIAKHEARIQEPRQASPAPPGIQQRIGALQRDPGAGGLYQTAGDRAPGRPERSESRGQDFVSSAPEYCWFFEKQRSVRERSLTRGM
jgi:hypothetical protein